MPSRRSNRSAAGAAAVEAVEAAEGVAAAGAAEAAAAEAAVAVAAVVRSGGAEPACPVDNPGTGSSEVWANPRDCVRPDWIAMTVEVGWRTPTISRVSR